MVWRFVCSNSDFFQFAIYIKFHGLVLSKNVNAIIVSEIGAPGVNFLKNKIKIYYAKKMNLLRRKGKHWKIKSMK